MRQEGFAAELYPSVARVLASSEPPEAVCLDLGSEQSETLESLQALRAEEPDLPVVVLGARRDAELAVAAMRAGAQDYVSRPLERRRLLEAVGAALEQGRLARAVRGDLVDGLEVLALAGESARICRVVSKVRRVLATDVAVCIQGERGTGKEAIARAIHARSRPEGPLVVVSFAIVPEEDHERTLFGDALSSFEAGTLRFGGAFQDARGGTLVLDEIERLSLSAQVSLVRALQHGRRNPRAAGSTVRIVSTTSVNLRRRVEEGCFREDLFFGLVVYPIELPSLRERRADIPALVGCALRQLSASRDTGVTGVEPDALRALMRHGWPGNVSELRHVVERAVLSSPAGNLRLASFPEGIRPAPTARPSLPAIEHEHDEIVPLRELERRAIRRALKAANGSVSRAAKLLGIGRATLYRRLSSIGAGRGAA